MRTWLSPLIVLAVSATASCSTSQDEPKAVPSASPSSSPEKSTPTPIATRSREPASSLTGYGATSKVWDQHHSEARGTKFAKGAVFDKDGSLDSAAVGAYRFNGVTRTDKGHINGYYQNFPPGTSPSEAKQLILDQLPSDTTELWQRKFATCIQIEYRSKTLARISKADPDLTDGISVALVHTTDDGDLSPNLKSINSSIIGIGYLDSADDAPSC